MCIRDRSGVAAGLVAAAEAAARGRGVSRITLAVAIGNETACRLYERLGYIVYGVEPCAMRLNGVFVDEELRSKFLIEPASTERSASIAA